MIVSFEGAGELRSSDNPIVPAMSYQLPAMPQVYASTKLDRIFITARLIIALFKH
jgi:hypothetical protein